MSLAKSRNIEKFNLCTKDDTLNLAWLGNLKLKMRYSRPFSQIGIFHFSLCLVLFALAWGLIYLDGWDFSLKSDNELCYLTLCQQPTTLRVSLKREETSLLIVVGVLNNILYNNHSRSEDLEIYLGHGIYPPNL